MLQVKDLKVNADIGKKIKPGFFFLTKWILNSYFQWVWLKGEMQHVETSRAPSPPHIFMLSMARFGEKLLCAF